jgi:DNA-binding NarL/FixJ family response regulator
MSIKILLADDHRITRQGLRSLLEKEPDMEVIAEAEDGRTTVRLARELLPDVVVMDVTMPDLNGIEATRQILAELQHQGNRAIDAFRQSLCF